MTLSALATVTTVSLTYPCRAIFESHLAERIMERCTREFCWTSPRPDIETALHEVLQNSAVHEIMGCVSNYDAYQDCLDYWERCRAMADTLLGDTPVHIEIWEDGEAIWLSCTPSRPPLLPVPSGKAHGHGLRIIRALSSSMEWDTATRRILLSFPHQRNGHG